MAGWRKNVLIVDDNLEELFRLRSSMKYAGYHVREAQGGDEALSILAGDDVPALVILDLDMHEGADGMDVLRRILAMPLERQPSVVVVAEPGRRQQAIEAVRLGAADFVQKPWKDADLQQSVAEALKGPQPKRAAIPHSGSELLTMIRRELSNKHFEHARRIFEESADTVGGEAAYFNLLGVLSESENDSRSARAFYRKAAVWTGPFANAAKHNLRRLDDIEERGQSYTEVQLGDEEPSAPRTPSAGSRLLARLFGRSK